MTAPPRVTSLAPVLLGVVMTAVVLGALVWHFHLHNLEDQIAQRKSALKRLSVSQGIAPTEDVFAYLKERDEALLKAYHQWLDRIVVADTAETASADLQLFFQERVHEAQRALERLAAGRNVAVPEIIGLPKELPPTETVPRLLAQLALAQTAAGLILEQGTIPISTIKLEDPEPINGTDSRAVLLTRVPLRVRMTSTLPQLMRLLEAFGRARPLIDVRTLRLVNGAQGGDLLESELVLARYLPSTQLDTLLEEEVETKEVENKAELPKEDPGPSKKQRTGQRKPTRAETDDGA